MLFDFCVVLLWHVAELFLVSYCFVNYIWAPSSEFVSSSIPSWQISTAHAQPLRGARDLAFCLKVPLDSLLIWASSEGSGETARMRRLAWTFAARIGDKYQIRLTRSILFKFCSFLCWLSSCVFTLCRYMFYSLFSISLLYLFYFPTTIPYLLFAYLLLVRNVYGLYLWILHSINFSSSNKFWCLSALFDLFFFSPDQRELVILNCYIVICYITVYIVH